MSHPQDRQQLKILTSEDSAAPEGSPEAINTAEAKRRALAVQNHNAQARFWYRQDRAWTNFRSANLDAYDEFKRDMNRAMDLLVVEAELTPQSIADINEAGDNMTNTVVHATLQVGMSCSSSDISGKVIGQNPTLIEVTLAIQHVDPEHSRFAPHSPPTFTDKGLLEVFLTRENAEKGDHERAWRKQNVTFSVAVPGHSTGIACEGHTLRLNTFR
jgi:hypothetical protein